MAIYSILCHVIRLADATSKIMARCCSMRGQRLKRWPGIVPALQTSRCMCLLASRQSDTGQCGTLVFTMAHGPS